MGTLKVMGIIGVILSVIWMFVTAPPNGEVEPGFGIALYLLVLSIVAIVQTRKGKKHSN